MPTPTLTPEQIREENKLVDAAKRNPRRFGVIYQRYHHPMFLFVFKRIQNEEATADVVSQLFLKAMTKLDSYQFRGLPFSAWLYRIAVNEVNQYFRDSKKQRHVSIETVNLTGLMEEAEELPTDENMQCLVAGLQILSPEELEFLELRYFEKVPFRELAAIYQITETNAKVRMHRMLKKLKKYMEQTREQTPG